MKKTLLVSLVLVLTAGLAASPSSSGSPQVRATRTIAAGAAVESVYPSELSPGREYLLMVKGPRLAANMALSFGEGIEIVKPLRITGPGRGAVTVRVLPNAPLGVRRISATVGGRETAQPGQLRIVAAGAAASRAAGRAARSTLARPSRIPSGLKPGLAESMKTTTILVGTKVFAVPGTSQNKEFPIPFDKEMALAEANIKKSGPIWLTFQWRTFLPGTVRTEWQVFKLPVSYDLIEAANPPGLEAKGDAPNVPAPGTDGYFSIDFRQFYGPPPGSAAATSKRTRSSTAAAAAGRTGSRTRLTTGTQTAKRDMMKTPAAAGSLRSLMLSKYAAFAQATKKASQWRPFYVRIVLYKDGNVPAAVSSYVTVRPQPEQPVDMYPDALQQSSGANRVNIPDLRVASYTPDEWHYPEERMYNYIVLANCPKYIQDTWGWTPGMKVNMAPHKEDKEWYEYLGDAVGAVIDSFASLLNWVSATWANLQAQFVNGICFGNADCASLAGPALKYGLTCLGVPPEIPNFNQLCSMGVDYLSTYIASQVPGGELAEDQIKDGIYKLADVVNNPPGSSGGMFSYLWPDPDFQNKPAYVMVEAYNPTSDPTDGMTLGLRFGSQSGDSTRIPPDIAPFLDTRTDIPPLAPGTKLSIPVFLTENPEIHFVHGPGDNWGLYYNKPIVIYRGDTLEPVFRSQTNWFAQNGTVQNELSR